MSALPSSHSFFRDRPRARVAVVGARGYSGLELARLLLRHPDADLKACFATSNFCLSDSLSQPAARGVTGYAIEKLLPMAKDFDFIFLATPAPTSMELAPKLLELGLHVIDLSGAYRLGIGSVLDTYREWYGFEHTSPKLLTRAHYGLVPWAIPAEDGNPLLVSNPGCFATAVLMGLLPLLKNRLVDTETLVIDAKSGTTGAGKKAEERLLHSEVDGGFSPYRIGRHQHTPEIQQIVRAFTNLDVDSHFTTSLMNVRRGIVASLYARLNSSAAEKLASAFALAYDNDPLVDVVELTSENETATLNLRRIVGTARTRIAYRTIRDKLYMFVMIDNLMKGAASQAIENFNCLRGLPSWSTLVEMEGSI